VGRPLPAAVGFNAGCDMSKLVGVGIPTVICGPGELAQAHGPDEYVEIQQVLDAVDVYEAIARDLLARGRG
jgi:acetylornithine deacetylase/succinyl-diaminopimelate desuccinylase-like protein